MPVAPHRFDVMVVGGFNPDIVLAGPDVRPEFDQHEKLVADGALVVGGSASITACACARLGLRTAVVGATGDDALGRFMRDRLNEQGVDTSLAPVLDGERTGFSVVLSEGADRAILTYPGTIDRLDAAHLGTDVLASARHVHVASYFLQPRLAALLPMVFRALNDHGTTVSVDPNWDPSGEWDMGLARLLDQVDVFLPNRAEAAALSGATGADGAAAALATGRRCVVAVKDGGNGASAAGPEGRASCPPFPVQTVDATGAGDAFDAGFLYGHLAGWPLEERLRFACAAGALSTRGLGATAAQASAAEVQALLAGQL